MSIKLLKTKICLKFLLFKVIFIVYTHWIVYFVTNAKIPLSTEIMENTGVQQQSVKPVHTQLFYNNSLWEKPTGSSFRHIFKMLGTKTERRHFV